MPLTLFTSAFWERAQAQGSRSTVLVRCVIVVLFLGLAWGQPKQAEKTDAEVKQAIINESIV
jgi:hypothetical protein